MILFVACNPSKLNTDPEVAMIGSKSEHRFNEWVKFLVPPGEDWAVINVSDTITEPRKAPKFKDFNMPRLKRYTTDPTVTRVIALGNTAAFALDLLAVDYFKLPHPSPLNRFLNNKIYLDAVLEECKNWMGQ